MHLIISLLLVSLLVVLGKDFIKKYAISCYLVATLLSAILVICSYTGITKHFPLWIRSSVWPILAKSTLATSIFIVVMFAGVFPNGSRPQKHLMPIRGELSIIASILTLGHNISYGRTYFKLLITKPEQLPLNQLLAAICSLTMLCIMIPLFITSFKIVRRKMNGRSWKKLQRLAYGFYALIYIHVLLLMMPKSMEGVTSYRLNLITYSIVFLSYAALRIRKALIKRTVILQQIPVVVSSVLLIIICFLSFYPLSDDTPAYPEPAKSMVTATTDSVAVLSTPALSEAETLKSTPTTSEASGTTDTPKLARYTSGTYTGSGTGYVDEITVKVTIEDNQIVSIRPVSFSEDEPYWTDSKQVINLILSTQSTDVDAISGATTSSKGIIKAVMDALDKAREQ